jgi:tetratricopeptide (TPR) repeat protein
MQQAEVYYLLGEIARLENQEKLAIINYEKSLQYHQKQVLVLNRLAWLLATQEDPKIRNAKRAVDLVNFMLQAPAVAQSPEHLGTAAAAYAAAGDFTKAVALTQKVINLLKEKQEFDRLKEQEKRLLLYQSNEFLTE